MRDGRLGIVRGKLGDAFSLSATRDSHWGECKSTVAHSPQPPRPRRSSLSPIPRSPPGNSSRDCLTNFAARCATHSVLSHFSRAVTTQTAEDVSALQEHDVKSKKGPGGTTDRTERVRRASHLRDSILQQAQERGHGAVDVARSIDMSVGHWYRIKKEPLRLAGLTLDRIQAVATYVGWPRVHVMTAVGWIRGSELEQLMLREPTLQSALRRLERGGLANGLTTPLSQAAPDHQALLGRLWLLAEAALVRVAAVAQD